MRVHSFHWMQSLDLHFKQWDGDKYAELSNFPLNNYKQCLQIIAENTVEVAQLKAELGIEVTAFYDWLKQEKAFLSGLCEPQDEHVLECAYVQALIMCQWAEYVVYGNLSQQDTDTVSREKLEHVHHDWIVISYHQEPDYSSDAHQTQCIKAARCTAFDELTLTIQVNQLSPLFRLIKT
ncbi:hypothetical protein NUW54_g10068 [Trametes sanguinea]|uniref:Uncharacterized protein n=1 Tax=Trametes sanguinea TaxID=158606 RepID=A0ACC1P1V6_9APHY|nr:hypothetical protein NUW54_g10068 [Trametes sanguinea]